MYDIKKTHQLKLRIFMVSCLCILSFFLAFSTVGAEGKVAKTPPPPGNIGIMGVFDPDHQYLDDGYGNIADLGNQDVQLSGYTRAKQFVDVVGVKLHLERWTGTLWINISTHSHTSTNEITIDAYESETVLSGYYYRVRTEHWVEENNTIEQGTAYSSSILIN